MDNLILDKINKALKEVKKEKEVDKFIKENANEFALLEKKVLNYVTYMKRTEFEVRKKFEKENQEILEMIITELENQEFLNDDMFVKVFLQNAIKTKINSIFELKMKLKQKGISNYLIDKNIKELEPELNNYEIKNIKQIIQNKRNDDEQKIKLYILRKGYLKENLNIAKEE